MNGREIVNMICDWCDKNNVSPHDIQHMTVAELLNQMTKDKGDANV